MSQNFQTDPYRRAFRAAVSPILVTTGVSGRGIDVANVLHVINYDLPDVEHNGEDEYIHRIGRTARIGNRGLATSFYNENDEGIAPFLTKTLVECGQAVPEFLNDFKPPENEPIDWNDDSGVESEGDAGAEAGDDAWGADDAAATGDAGGSTWTATDTSAPVADASAGW